MSTATVPAGGGQVPAQVHPAVLNAIQCFPEILGLQGQDSPYTITKPIGSGVSGTAFLVVHHGKKLIAKITHLEGMNAKRREYARNEIHCLAQCEHFAIVKHHAHFEKETHLLLVMELADAGDLERQIAQRARGTTQAPGPMYFQEHEVAFLFLQVILAVDYVHRSRMLHRDLKSANVFVLSRGITKIGDFGFSQQYDDTVSGAVAGTFCGTPYYLAPELWRRQRYSKKADVWALGVLLYEMAALRRPFVADSMINLMDKVMSGHVDPFPEAAGYSPDLFHVVRWALTFDQYARPDTKQLLAHPYMQMTMKEFVLSVDRSDKFSAEEKRGMFSEITAATAHLAAAPSAGPSQQDIYAQTQAHAQQQAQVQAQQQQHAQHQQVQYAPGVQQVPVHNMQQITQQMQGMAIQQQHPQTVAPPSPHHQMPAQQQHQQVLQQAPPQHQQQQPQQQPQQQVVVYQDSNGQQYQQQAFHHQQQPPPGAMVVRDHNGQQIVYVPITTPTPSQHQQHVPAPVAPAAAPVVVGDAQAAQQQAPPQSVPMQQHQQHQPVQGTSGASAATAAAVQPPHLPTQTQPQGEQASRSQRARGAFQPCEGLVEKRGSRGWRRRRLILNADTLTVDLIPEDGAATPTNGGGGGGANSIAGTAPGVDAKSMPVSRIGDVMPLPANASAAEGRPAVFAVAVDGGAQLLFQAESAVARDAWIDRIREAMITDDCRRFA